MSPDLRRDLSQSTGVSLTGIVGTGSTVNVDTLKPDTLLRRKQLAEALSVAGFPIAVATLSTMASRGGGPPFQLWGRLPLYTWGCALAWAESRLSEPAASRCARRSGTCDADSLRMAIPALAIEHEAEKIRGAASRHDPLPHLADDQGGRRRKTPRGK